MSDDIVTRLRRAADPDNQVRIDSWHDMAVTAADEIERLRAEVKDLRNTHRAIYALTWEIARENPSHLKAWIDIRQMANDDKEARRG